jgi:hypothetical protein
MKTVFNFKTTQWPSRLREDGPATESLFNVEWMVIALKLAKAKSEPGAVATGQMLNVFLSDRNLLRFKVESLAGRYGSQLIL